MCAIYNIDKLAEAIEAFTDAISLWRRPAGENSTVAPSIEAPIVVQNGNQRQIVGAAFGLQPHGRAGKRPLNNSRIENLAGWPWKNHVFGCRCVIPLTSFFEWSYWGEMAGHKLQFECATQPILLAAGIFAEHKKALSMSMITRPANHSMMQLGHHRMPCFVKPDAIEEWTDPRRMELVDCHQTLVQYAHDPEWEVIDHGEMKTGWQKRVDDRIAKRDAQIAEIEATGPLGIS